MSLKNRHPSGASEACLGCFIAIAVFCHATFAANLTTTSVVAAGADWTGAIWKTNGVGTSVSPVPGNVYACVSNGTPFGNNLNNTRIRNPAVSGVQTFPGNSLTLNTNTEIRIKGPGAILNFPGVGGAPGLILNGGVVGVGDDAVFSITGSVQVSGQSYLCPGDNGGGVVEPLRGINLSGILSGSGTLVIMQAATSVAQQFSGTQNTFGGQWILKAGWLLGSGSNSLGTNSITVDPNFAPPLDSSVMNIQGPTIFEPGYDLNSAGILTLTNGGVMNLHQNCIFSAVYVQGVALSAGTHYYAQLSASFPNNFATGGSGSLIVQPYGPPPPLPPAITTQPLSVTLNAGGPTQLSVAATGAPPLVFQWQKGSNGVFINAPGGGDVSGAQTPTLSFSAVTSFDGADYRLIVTNSMGAVTSQVATITVNLPDSTKPTIASLAPAAGAIVNTFSQIQVIFTKNVQGISAADLLINGIPTSAVSGGGSNYIFTFSQPAPGIVPIDWDSDSGITDLAGNYFDTSAAWTVTLADNIPPLLVSVMPYQGATVGQLTGAQVIFSEPVAGVAAADLLVNGSPASSVTGGGAGPYVFQFTQPAAGAVQFSWAAATAIADLAPAANLFVGSGAGWALTLNPAAASAALTNIVINEFLAANVNTNGLRDEDGELDDWIEIYNRGTTAVNLGGWLLTDTPDLSDTWTFPATNIAAGHYMVVFASGKNRTTPGSNLHLSFSLGKTGEYLGLYNADFPPKAAFQYSPSYPQQFNDYSYGINSSNGLSYFQNQTPGGPNSATTLNGAVDTVNFSVKHGYFNQPFNLYLTTATPGASVIYTTDGSQPSISGNTTNGKVFSGPISIQQTTVLRAAGFAPKLLPSPVGSESFFYVESVIRQPNNPPGYPTGNVWTPTPSQVVNGSRAYYEMDPTIVNDPQYTNMVRQGLTSIPTLSIMTSIDDMFGPNNGIYTHTSDATADSYRGPLWERGCSMELIFPDGSSDGIQLDCGIEIQGGSQRDPAKNPKHSFRLKFTSQYGPGRLDFPFYPDSPVTSFNTLVIDSGINYWWHYVGGNVPADQRFRAQDVRDQYASDLMLALGHPSFHGRFVNLYLNGLYWGIQYLHERPDADFAASYFGGETTNYDVIKNTTFGLESLSGDLIAWNTALGLSNNGLTNNGQYEVLQQYVDLDNLIDYMIVNHWGGNDDWPQHNWYCIRQRNPGGTYKFIVWDAEHVLKDVKENVTTVNATNSPAQIYLALTNNAEFRLLYADHLQKLFFNGGVFYTDPNPSNAVWDPAHPERNVPCSYYMKRINEINSAVVDESARWGGYLLTTNYTRNDHWLRELNNLLGYTNTPGNTTNYFPIRSSNVLAQYKAIGLFPGINAPIFSQLGGNVAVGFALTMTNPNPAGKIYYTTNGTDPRVYGSGAVSLAAMDYTNGAPVILNGSAIVQARSLNGSWSALASGNFNVASLGIPIRITELMYEPVGGSSYEFIELQNIGDIAVDMSGYSFSGITYVFPNGATLAPGGVMVIANNGSPAAFASRYPGVVVAGYYSGNLSNSGERIALLDQNGNTVTAVNYNNANGWPLAAVGGGSSLQILNPNGDPDDPANWIASPALNGSPGVVIPVVFTNAVRLNEVMAANDGLINNAGTYPDWVEFANTGTNSVSLADWSFSNSGNARKFVFPDGTSISGGGFLIVWCDTNTTAPGLHSGFNLSRTGENLFLYDSATNRVDAFSFGLQLSNYSMGRVGVDAGWQLNQPTPGAPNLTTNLAAGANLAINEWMANSAPGGTDWIELYNKSSNQPVLLTGLYLATSNELFEIRSASFIAPLGYVQLFADNSVGPDHFDFKLTAAGDAITLYDYSGLAIDSVRFANQIQGVSQGRLPDGASNIVSFSGTSSPAASNYISSYNGPVLNEVMARNTSTVYDARGHTPSWIEIYNPTGTSFNLAGMSLGVNLYGTGQWTFPVGSAIAANSYLLVWHDPSQAGSTSFTSNLNTGYGIAGDGGAVCLFSATGQLVDSVAFGAQISDVSIGRSGGGWNLLRSPTPAAPNAVQALLGNSASLSVNEWLAAPSSGSDWFELYNSDSLPVSLSGLYLTDDPSLSGMTNTQLGALSFVAGHGWVEFLADGHPGLGPNHVNFSLSKNGETVRLYATNLSLIDAADFGLQSTDVSQGRLPDGGANLVSFISTPTPADSNFLPLQNVVVNEVLSHANFPLEQAIELYNSTGANVALDGWFLSDNETNFLKYRIPNGTTLAGGGYEVFYQAQFDGTNPIPFALNPAHGGHVFLSQADSQGNLTGYRAQVSFGAAEDGVSFGRFPTSAGVDFTAMGSITFGQNTPSTVAQFRTGTGQTNSYPNVGPIVINEILYEPLATSGTENTTNEYIELFNMTSNMVPLFDVNATTNTWQLGGDVTYSFPGGSFLQAGGFLVLVGFDPAANPSSLAEFRTTYNLATNVSIYGPFTGGPLPNDHGTLQLFRPGAPEIFPAVDAGYVPSILVDSITYSNAAPWPAAAAGGGMSLQRDYLGLYGNEPLNWVASAPTPGARNFLSDTDGDGLPDDWELANNLNPYSAAGRDGANGDPDGDGFGNLQEYLAGTNPHDAQSFLAISSVTPIAGGVTLRFNGIAGHSYSVQYRNDLSIGSWQKLADIPALTANGAVVTTDLAGAFSARYYRLVTPIVP